MSGFINKAACSGRRPSQFAGYGGYQRSELMTRLLAERLVARFVVAPQGYGKTSLLVDYAETVFEWRHVFWINAQSPCFLRDLDEGSIAADCLEADRDVHLVVFDDVPVLDGGRAEQFSQQLDRLIDAQCEVAVTCTPRCDMFRQLQRDCVRLGPRDMLLSDEELELARSIKGSVVPKGNVPDALRVPALVWGPTSSVGGFIRGVLKEPMPADMLLATGSMLVLHQGDLDDLRPFGPLDLQLVTELAVDYPHLGFDEDTRRFQTPVFKVDDLAGAMRGSLDAMVACTSFETRNELVCAWAEALAAKNESLGRACDVVRKMGLRAKQASWLAEHAADVVRGGRFYEGSLLAASSTSLVKGIPATARESCVALGSVCNMMLGDKRAAVRLAKRFCFETTASLAVRACCLMVIARLGTDTLRDRAAHDLLALAGKMNAADPEDLSFWEALVVLWEASHGGMQKLAGRWALMQHGKADESALCVAASWLFSLVSDEYARGDAYAVASLAGSLADAERFVRRKLSQLPENAPDFLVVSAALAMERAHTVGMMLREGALSTSDLLMLRRVEMSLLEQRTRWQNDVRAEESTAQDKLHKQVIYNASEGAGIAPGASASRSVPVLTVKMFGRFEVLIGNEPVEERFFRRRHVRFLLVILTSNLGRDVSRASLAALLWPDVSADQARRNFYATWSKLRRALSLPDGSCPYLVRHQYGCSLDDRRVHSDVVRHAEICRELMFGSPNQKTWSALYTEIDRDFSNELLPSEVECDLIQQMRDDYRGRLVDALIAGSYAVTAEGNQQMAIWFARSAVNHDETREDAYVALMRAQIANEQRTAAMMTYHSCRRVLSERLGVDPSPETTRLYESLLGSD